MMQQPDTSFDTKNPPDNLFIKINNEDISFIKSKCFGTTSAYYISDKTEYFLKLVCDYNDYNVLEREVIILKILAKYNKHFPKLIAYNNQYIITEYIGPVLNKNNPDIIKQANIILNILANEMISHSDIKEGELLIKDNTLYLVDFGWASLNGDLSCGNKISDKRQNFATNDRTEMFRTIYKINIDR